MGIFPKLIHFYDFKDEGLIECVKEFVKTGKIAFEILYDNLNLLYFEKELKGKYQICAAGFNISKYGDKHYVNPYYQYLEQLFTNNYKHLPKEYEDYLMQYVPDNNYDYNEIYRRLWGMDTVNYGKSYNFIDVSLVPLQQNLFTACKSELKLIEAGFMKKAVIVSND